MQIRHLVVAVLMASATAAHADVISPAGAGFLSGWTAGNGADVIGSGALAGSSLIGGVAYSTTGGSTMIDALYSKASAALGQTGSVYLANGIEGQYMVGAGNGIMAALLGNSVSVVNDANGVQVTRLAAANAVVPAAPGAPATITTAGSTPAAPAAVIPVNDSILVVHTGSTGTSGDIATGGNTGIGTDISFPLVTDTAGRGGLVQPAAVDATVPEPSSIALMLVGLLGAGTLARRRS